LIAENSGDNRWGIWKKQSINDNKSGKVKTFFALLGKEIIGEVTLIFEKSELNALRVNKEYEGKGVASELVKFVENWAIGRGIKYLIIGVEPCEVRNMQIYFHWGYTDFVESKHETLINEEILVLYYKKDLRRNK